MFRYLNRAVRNIELILLIFLCACAPTKEARIKTTVAVLLQTSDNPFFELMWEGIRLEAARRNMEVHIYWPEKVGDFEYQYKVLNDKAANYDVLIFSPSEPNKTATYLPAIKSSGTSVVLVDTGIKLPAGVDEQDYYDVFIGTDNEVGGALAAEYAKRRLSGGGTIAVLAGFKQTIEAPGRVKSFIDEVRKALPGALVHVFVGDYDRNIAHDVVSKNLDTFLQSDLIYAANDYMALGMLDAFKEAGVKRLPSIIGYDSMREAQKAILAGTMDASVVQFPTRMGREAIRVAAALTDGERVPRVIMIEPMLSVRKVIIDTVGIEEIRRR